MTQQANKGMRRIRRYRICFQRVASGLEQKLQSGKALLSVDNLTPRNLGDPTRPLLYYYGSKEVTTRGLTRAQRFVSYPGDIFPKKAPNAQSPKRTVAEKVGQ